MKKHPKTVGVLALHGDFAEHAAVLAQLRVAVHEVRSSADLDTVDRLIFPGGESTVVSQLLEENDLRSAILRRHRQGTLPLFGTCAGLILLAHEVRGSTSLRTLDLLDVTVERNAYGRQIDSFEASLTLTGDHTSLRARFIRAPKIVRVGKSVEVLATHAGDPVIVRCGDVLGATCHPEVCGETALHRLFLSL